MKPTQKNRPYTVSVVRQDGLDEPARWTQVGVAFLHKDGNGFNVELAAWPLDGRLVIRAPKDKTEADQETAR